MTTSIVWVVKEQSHGGGNVMDYTPAMKYGDIKFITRTDVPLYPDSGIRMRWADDVAKFVEEYDQDRDMIVATGQPTSIFAVGHALGVVRKTPRYLVWRREDNQYRVCETPISVGA